VFDGKLTKWRKLVVVTKIYIWRILMKFAKFLLSDKRKMAFLTWKFFEAYLSWAAHCFGWRNLGFVAKFLTKIALFDKWKDKWKPKAAKLFWQDFIELDNSYSYAQLNKSFFQMVKFGKIWDLRQSFWQNLHFLTNRNGIFGGNILWSLTIRTTIAVTCMCSVHSHNSQFL